MLYFQTTKGDKVGEGSLDAYDVDYTNATTFTADHINSSEIVCAYGAGGGQVAQAQFIV